MIYEDLLPGKMWVENEVNKIAEIYNKNVELRNWIDPDQWKSEKHFRRGDVGLEINLEGRIKVVTFKDTDLENCRSTPRIQNRLLKYIKEKLR